MNYKYSINKKALFNIPAHYLNNTNQFVPVLAGPKVIDLKKLLQKLTAAVVVTPQTDRERIFERNRRKIAACMSSSCTRTKMEVTSDGKDLPCIPKEELKVDVLKAKKTKTKRPDKVKTATARQKAEGEEEQEKERREKKFVSIKDEWERKSNKTSGSNEKGKDYVKKKKKANIDDNDKVSKDEDLYRNWKAIVDPSSGKTYYYNRVTKKKTREKPLRYNDDRNVTSSAAAMKAKKTDRKKKYGLGDDCKVLSGSKIYAATEADKANENEDKKKKKKKSKDGSLSQKQRDDASLVSHKKRKEKAKKKASRSSQSSEYL